MSATSSKGAARARRFSGPREDDPRVLRSRSAAVDAARMLFLEKGYVGTTMEDIAAAAGLTKRTLYNNYPDKDALFTRIVGDVIAFAEEFARALHDRFHTGVSAQNLRTVLDELAREMAQSIVRPEVIALRRLLVGESRAFPALARDYFERAPGAVIEALAREFEHLAKLGVLRVANARTAASQFAYLIVGEPLDRAMLVGAPPSKAHIAAAAREGVETFVARYAAPRPGRK